MKSKIYRELQESENNVEGGHDLNTNDELISHISDFGHGKTEFHTVDVARLIDENEAMQDKLNAIIHAQYGSGSLAALNNRVSEARDFLDGII